MLPPRRAFAFSLLAACAALSACRPATPRLPEAPAPRALPAGFDFQALAERTRLAFRSAGGGTFAAQAGPVRATVEPSGAVSISLGATRATVRLSGVRRAAGRAEPVPAPQRVELSADAQTARLLRPDLEERWTSTARGVEQSFVLQRPPAGAGDVVLELSVQGERWSGRKGAAHRFGGGPSALAMGEAFALAGGERVALKATRTEQGIALHVPEALARREELWPLTVDPLWGPETPTDPTLSTTGAALAQSWPQVAFNGAVFLVVWPDLRMGTDQVEVYAARVTPQGQVLDLTGIRLTSLATDGRSPAVASTNGEFYAVWAENGANLKGTRVLGDGTVVSPGGASLAGSTLPGLRPALAPIAGTSTYFLVYAVDAGNQDDLYARVVMPTTGAAGAAFPVTTAASHAALHDVALTAAGSGAVSWREVFPDAGQASMVVAVTAAGPVGPAVALGPGTARGLPALACSADRCFAAWADALGGAPVVHAQELDLLSSSARGSPVAIFTGATGEEVSGTPEPDGYSFCFHDSAAGEIRLARVLPDGGSSAGPVVVTQGRSVSEAACDVAWGAGATLAVWEDGRLAGSAPDIFGARVDADGGVLDQGLLVSSAGNGQLLPRVAASATQFLVTWADTRAAAAGYYARVGFDGTVIDNPGRPITSRAVAERDFKVASNGIDFLTVWADLDTDVWGARILADGTLFDTLGKRLISGANRQRSPAVAASRGVWLVVAEDERTGIPHLTGVRVAPNGILDLQGLAVTASAAQAQSEPHVAPSADGWVVAWRDTRTLPWGDVYAARVAPTGQVLDDEGKRVSQSNNLILNPRVAWNGTRIVAAWTDYGTGATPSGPQVHFAEQSDAGGWGAPAALRAGSAPVSGFFEALAFGTQGGAVVWGQGPRVYYGELADNGQVVDAGTITPGPGADLAWSGGAGLLAYSRLDSATQTNAPRVFHRALGTAAAGGFDAGLPADAGAANDGGALADGGAAPDAGAEPDGGVENDGGAGGGGGGDGSAGAYLVGCGCGGSAADPLGLLGALWLFARVRAARRRGRRSVGDPRKAV